jgi:hypothetical protein
VLSFFYHLSIPSLFPSLVFFLFDEFSYKISCDKSNELLTVSSQNSFGQISFKVGEQVKFKIDIESVVGFFD